MVAAITEALVPDYIVARPDPTLFRVDYEQTPGKRLFLVETPGLLHAQIARMYGTTICVSPTADDHYQVTIQQASATQRSSRTRIATPEINVISIWVPPRTSISISAAREALEVMLSPLGIMPADVFFFGSSQSAVATGRLGVRFWLADQVDWHKLHMQKHCEFQLPHGFGQSSLKYDPRFMTEHGMCSQTGCLRVIRGSRNARGLGVRDRRQAFRGSEHHQLGLGLRVHRRRRLLAAGHEVEVRQRAARRRRVR